MAGLKLDDTTASRIVEAVRAGASRTAAAEASLISRSTLHRWLQLGGRGEEPYASLQARVRQAEGELESELLKTIKKHSANSWQAAAWILERKFQKRWALRRERADREPQLSPGDADRLVVEAVRMASGELRDQIRQLVGGRDDA